MKPKEFYQKHKCKFLIASTFLFGNGTGGFTITELTDNVVRIVEVIKKPIEKPAADLTEVKNNIERKEDFKEMNVSYSQRTLTGTKPTRAK